MLSNDAKRSEEIRAKHQASKASISQRKLVFGFGINDADYIIKPKVLGSQLCCQAYEAWHGMLKRCFHLKFHEKFPTYSGCSVSRQWESFMDFRSWWINSHQDGWRMDKDLLIAGNKHYSKETAIYVPEWLNNFTLGSKKTRGSQPVGVMLHKPTGRFLANCCDPISGKREFLGSHGSPEEAHQAWKNKKIQIANILKPEMDCIDGRIYPNVVQIINGGLS